ncbi:MFS transporter [Pseudonocardia sp.]|uniref:MFS transporter n=1 Tax=Pseudonocardia sp. TaxID=60912 RepID=UPI003D151724
MSAPEPAPLGALTLVRTHGPYRTLWAARGVSLLGDALSLVALILHVASTTGEALAVTVLLLVGDVAPALAAPVLGAIADRVDLRRLMIGCDVAQAAVTVVLALLLPPLPVLLVLVATRALLGQLFAPASRAAVPGLVHDRDLEGANAGIGFGANVAEIAGPLLAAALLVVADIRVVLLVDAATFAVSALVLLRLPPLPRPSVSRTAPAEPSMFAQARAGIGYVRRTPLVRIVVVAFCAVVAANGVDDVALVFVVRDLGAPDFVLALLYAAVGVGLLAGYLWLGRRRAPATVALFVAGMAVSSLGNLLTGVVWAAAAAVAMQAVRGAGLAVKDVAATTILQRIVPAGMQGRVFANLYGGIGVAAAISYVGGGLLLQATSARTTMIVAGGVGVLVTALTAWRLGRVTAASAAGQD